MSKGRVAVPEEINRAKAIVAQTPGIPDERLAVRIGIALDPPGTHNRSHQLRKMIKALTQAGVLYAERDQFATPTDRPKCYPIGYQKPTKTLFVPAKDRHQRGCKTFTVPLDQLGQYTHQSPSLPQKEINVPRRTKEQAIEDIDRALEKLQATGKPFTKTDVCHEAELGGSFLSRYPDENDRISQAVAASKKIDLQAQIDRLKAINTELQQQIEAQHKPQVSSALPPIAWLKNQYELERASADRIEEQVCELYHRLNELQMARDAALNRAVVWKQAIDQFEPAIDIPNDNHKLEAIAC